MGLLQDEGFGRLQCSYGQVGPEGSLVSVPALRVPDENNSGSLRNMEYYSDKPPRPVVKCADSTD